MKPKLGYEIQKTSLFEKLVRLINYLKLENQTLTFIYIYDKSQLENISEDRLDKIIIELLKDTENN